MAKPTLYHYFRAKDEILRGIHETFIDLLLESKYERIRLGQAPADLLLGAMTDIFVLMETNVRVFFEHHREAAQRGPPGDPDLAGPLQAAHPRRRDRAHPYRGVPPGRYPTPQRWPSSASVTVPTNGGGPAAARIPGTPRRRCGTSSSAA